MSASAGKAVFLSYASQDVEAAKRIADALRASGIEVWLDQSELVGGDAWDQKIRGQVATCALFVPIVSANTQARREGYFRLEWKLADERTHQMAEGTPFLLPVVIDETKDREALVPKSFLSVQWTRLPGGEKAEAFGVRAMKLLGGDAIVVGPVVDRVPGQRPSLQPKVGRRVPAGVWGVAVAALALAVGGYFWFKSPKESALISAQNAGAGTRPPTSEKAAPAEAKSVAVLAFKNLSGDPEREFFSDGLSDAVTHVLGRVPGLKVVGSASAFSFKGKPILISEIARQLGVTHLVEGTVLQEGQTVRITAKLITADGFQVWVSDKLEREAKNIFALHDEVAGLIAKNLSLKLGASSAASKAAVNPQAYELYVQGRQAWNLRTSAGYDLAESALTRALSLEPNFARAHAALADVWMLRLMRAQNATETWDQSNSAGKERIRAKIAQALTLDPDSAEAYASLGFELLNDHKYSDAEGALRRAVGLNPNYASAHQWLGRVLVALGQLDDALGHAKVATELDPLSPANWFVYGSVQSGARGMPAEGIIALDRALTLQPNFYVALRLKSIVLVRLGRFTEAVALVKQLPDDNVGTAPARVFVFARAGLKAEAEALLADPRSPVNSAREKANSLLALGRTEEAIALMTAKSINVNDRDCLWNPLYDPVRNDPRWVKLVADAGLTEVHARAQAWRKAHPPEKAAAK